MKKDKLRRDGSSRKGVEAKSYGKTAKLGAIWSVVRSLSKQLIAIPTSMIMARLLSPEEFGVAAAAGFFMLMASRSTELGLNTALVREKNLKPVHNSSVFVVSVVLGVVSWLTLTLAAPAVGRFFRSPEVGQVLPWAALMFLFTPFSTVPSALMQRQLRFKATSVADWLDSLTGSITAILLAWAGFGFWSLIYSALAAGVVQVIAKNWLARWRPSFRFSWPALRELLSFGLGIQAKRFLEFGAGNLDNLLIGRFISITALGLYDKAFMTAQRLQQTLNLGPAVSFRIFAIIQDDLPRFRRAYGKVLLTLGVVSIPPLAVCAAVGPQLFEVMYGVRWLACVPAFQILCIATAVKLISAHTTQANEAKGLVWRQALQKVIYVIFIVLGVGIGSWWGITGAAWGVLAARIILMFLVQRLLQQAMEASWPEMYQPLAPGTLIAVVLSGVVLLTEIVVRASFAHTPALALLAIQGIVAAPVFVLLVLYSPFASVRNVVRETITDFAPRFASWLPAPAIEPELKKVG